MTVETTERIGRITVGESGTLLVTDPCYIPDSLDDAVRVDGIAPGEYPVFVDLNDEERVMSLRLGREGRGRYVGQVGVDSGQMSISDAAILGEWGGDDRSDEKAGEDFGEFCRRHRGELNYLGACDATLAAPGGVIGDRAMAVSGTGYGDGVYSVYVACDHDGKVVSVTIDFAQDDEDEFDDD